MVLKFPKLTEWQQDVFEHVKESHGKGQIFTVRAKRQLGKTILAGVCLIYFAVTYEGTINHIIEPSNTNNRNIYRQIKKWLEPANIVEKFNDSLNEIIFKNGSEIRFLSAESRDRLRGQTTTGLLVFDEMAFLNDETIQLIMPYVDAHNAPMLCISTPMFCDGQYYRFYMNPDNKTSFSFDWTDPKYDISAFITKEKLEYYRKTMTEMRFKTEMLGQFIDSGGFVFKNILKCISQPSNKIATVGGIDFGTGSNGDYTFIVLFNDNKEMVDIQFTNNMDPMSQVDWLANIINSYPSLKSVFAEKNSIGNVYISALRKNLNKKSILHEFDTTNKSKKDIVEELVKAFSNETVKILDCNELIKQLQHFIVKKLSNGNYTYENDNPTIHDDAVIATCLAWHAFTSNKGTYNISFV